MTSIRDWCPGCNETGWACKCRETKPVMAETLVERLPDELRETARYAWERCDTVAAERCEAAANTIEALEGALRARDKVIGVFAEALDEADSIIAINCGTDTPKEWDRAFRRAQKARLALTSTDKPGVGG